MCYFIKILNVYFSFKIKKANIFGFRYCFLIYRLGYFEKKNTFLNISQLISQIPRHYKKQATNQIYVLLFGLDVFGNPLGLLRGIFEGGADLFYEPYQVYKILKHIFNSN